MTRKSYAKYMILLALVHRFAF